MSRTVWSRGLHRNVIILLKVNPCVARREQLTVVWRGRQRTKQWLNHRDRWTQETGHSVISSGPLTFPDARWGTVALTSPLHLWILQPNDCSLLFLLQSLHAHTCKETFVFNKNTAAQHHEYSIFSGSITSEQTALTGLFKSTYCLEK